jgi:hypothetical protein
MEIFNSKSMSKEERDYMKQIDEMILSASPKKLKQIQETDKNSQLLGTTFYDVYSNSKTNSKNENLESDIRSINKKSTK